MPQTVRMLSPRQQLELLRFLAVNDRKAELKRYPSCAREEILTKWRPLIQHYDEMLEKLPARMRIKQR